MCHKYKHMVALAVLISLMKTHSPVLHTHLARQKLDKKLVCLYRKQDAIFTPKTAFVAIRTSS